ncbi:predicted protein [Streptomyces sp. AA4]|nr:predicted protein [Streptomyces sp. AA4]
MPPIPQNPQYADAVYCQIDNENHEINIIARESGTYVFTFYVQVSSPGPATQTLTRRTTLDAGEQIDFNEIFNGYESGQDPKVVRFDYAWDPNPYEG